MLIIEHSRAPHNQGDSGAAARGEHDGGISGGQDFLNVGGSGERPCKMDAKRLAHGHERSVLNSNRSLSRAADELPEHEQSRPSIPRVQ